jgi:hypothetical protein
MTAELHALIAEASGMGVRLEVEHGKLLASPAGKLSEPLKAKLRERKPDVIRLLSEIASNRQLSESAARLQDADIRVAVYITETDAGMVVSDRLVQGEAQARQVWEEGGMVWTADEMLSYVNLSRAERRLFLELKGIRQRD